MGGFWEELNKGGGLFGMGNVADFMKLNMQNQMARQRHAESMKELERMYELRGGELERGHEMSMAELGERERLMKLDDLLERNRQLINSGHNIREQQLGIRGQLQVEKARHGYNVIEENLRYKHATDLAGYNKLYENSMRDIGYTMNLLGERKENIMNALRSAELTAGSEEADPKQRDFANRQIWMARQELGDIQKVEGTIRSQLQQFNRLGHSEYGHVDFDRQSYLDKMVETFKGQAAQYFGVDPDEINNMPMDQITLTLEKMMMEQTGEQLTPADISYIFSNWGKDIALRIVGKKK